MDVVVRDGVTVIDGEPRVLVSADYPYYRDDPSVWADRLVAIRDALGIDVITCYLPWRHHQPDPGVAPDFTTGSRDVTGFLRLCHELGLKVIAKPGPFIHAETDFGGLPDWVSPDADPAIEALLDASGTPQRWGATLPAPLGEVFAQLNAAWLAAVGEQVLDAAAHPAGPVILVQIANEGVYTNGALPLDAYDHSPSGLAFRAALGDDDPGRFHAAYLGGIYRRWADATGFAGPVVVNLNPPTIDDLDAWLARVRPPAWDRIHYGFTNWMGVVSADPDAWFRYVVAAKLAPGPNLEENWGFSELYDRAYADAATSFHQTLLAMAAGATGFNIYTGVATSTWSPALDSRHAPPYPDCPPIGPDGEATVKAPVVKALAGFFAAHGVEFLECVPVTGGAFGLWASCGAELRAFHDAIRESGRDYALVDLEHATPEQVLRHPVLTVPAGLPRLALLDSYTEAGGRVRTGPPDGDAAVRVVSGDADAFLRQHPGRDVAYLTVLARSTCEGPVVVEAAEVRVEATMARGGAAIVRLTGGEADDLIVKGINGYLDSAVAASLTVAGRTAGAGTRPTSSGSAAGPGC